MGTIVVFENVSLDGVIQNPTGEEGFTSENWRAGLDQADREGWDELALDDVSGAQALLLEQGPYEYFAARYPTRTGRLADRMNSLPKYVVSATLENPGWNNTTALGGDSLAEVSKLKRAIDGELHVYGSVHLVHTMIEHDLVDELRLAIFPLLLGAGSRVYDRPGTKPLHLVSARTVGAGLVHLVHRRRAF